MNINIYVLFQNFMSNYQKKILVPVPEHDENYEKKFHNWIRTVLGEDTFLKYKSIYDFHEQIVAEADKKGDRKVTFVHGHDKASRFIDIEWISEEVHMQYMNRIPIEDRQFYESIYNKFHEHLGTGYKC